MYACVFVWVFYVLFPACVCHCLCVCCAWGLERGVPIYGVCVCVCEREREREREIKREATCPKRRDK